MQKQYYCPDCGSGSPYINGNKPKFCSNCGFSIAKVISTSQSRSSSREEYEDEEDEESTFDIPDSLDFKLVDDRSSGIVHKLSDLASQQKTGFSRGKGSGYGAKSKKRILEGLKNEMKTNRGGSAGDSDSE